jgi:DNA repair protein RadC
MPKTSKQIKVNQKIIKNWPKDDRPREKLFKSGEHTLSNTELIAILLRNGTHGQSALDLSRKILSKFKTLRNMSHTDIRDWKEFKGLGQAKIAQVRAAIELGRRFSTENKQPKMKVKNSKEIVDLFMGRMRDLKTEVFKVLFLNNRNQLIEIAELSEGTVNQANPIVREIMSKALQTFASGLACVHNHPTGDCTPSKEDKQFTRELCQACKVMQTRVVDHIIIGDDTYFSFADRGQLGV